MAEIIEIEHIKPDVDPVEVGEIKNPLDVTFQCIYNKQYRITLKPGEKKPFPLNICIHVASHLADRIIYAEREIEIVKNATKQINREVRKKTKDKDGNEIEVTEVISDSIIDEKLLVEERKRAIPNFRDRKWEIMKSLVKSSSGFFKDKDVQRKATGHIDTLVEEEDFDIKEM